MVDFLWVLGTILFFLHMACKLYVSSPSAFRTRHKWESRALGLILSAVIIWGVALYLTSQLDIHQSKGETSCQIK